MLISCLCLFLGDGLNIDTTYKRRLAVVLLYGLVHCAKAMHTTSKGVGMVGHYRLLLDGQNSDFSSHPNNNGCLYV